VTIKNVKTKIEYEVQVEPIEDVDFKGLTQNRFSFVWKKEKDFSIWKLRLSGNTEILGLMSLDFIDSEMRVHIRLLANSIENVGSRKIYSGIASCLIAYACREAIVRYSDNACVSLIPKTNLREYYKREYGMVNAGQSICLIGNGLIKMIQKHNL